MNYTNVVHIDINSRTNKNNIVHITL